MFENVYLPLVNIRDFFKKTEGHHRPLDETLNRGPDFLWSQKKRMSPLVSKADWSGFLVLNGFLLIRQ